MDRSLFWFFCLLTALRSAKLDPVDPEITINGENLECKNGVFYPGPDPVPLTEEAYAIYSCVSNSSDGCPEDDTCPRQKILVKVLRSESLIQLETPATAVVLVSDILVTILIGWAVYSVCSQPRTRRSYQGNKASDQRSLITNNSAGETYQPLNAHTSEYSTLHGGRRPKNSKQPLSP